MLRFFIIIFLVSKMLIHLIFLPIFTTRHYFNFLLLLNYARNCELSIFSMKITLMIHDQFDDLFNSIFKIFINYMYFQTMCPYHFERRKVQLENDRQFNSF